MVQLQALGLQLEQLTAEPAKPEPDLSRRIETVFSLRLPLPSFSPERLDLFSRDGDDAMTAIPFLAGQLRSANVSDASLNVVQRLSAEHRQLTADVRRAHALSGRSARLLQLAKRFAHMHAAACCCLFRIYNRDILGAFFGQEEWLSRSLNRLHSDDETMGEDGYVEQELLDRFRHHRLFSAVPFQLASQGTTNG